MNNIGDLGSFIPTTQVFDIEDLKQMDPNSTEFKELIVRLYQNLNVHAMAVNAKDSGIYSDQEFVNGQTFFPDTTSSSDQRYVFRKVLSFGALPNNTTESLAHGITVTSGFIFTRIYGTASDTVGNEFIPLPYASSTAADNIELWVDDTDVTITTGSDWSAYTTTYIVLEYLKF